MAGSGSNRNPEKGLHSTSPSLSKETPSSARRQVLIVEDNQSDAYLIQRAIEGTNLPIDFHVVRDGQQAVQFFDQADADPARTCPDIVILDLNLPKKQGGDVLKHMRSRSRCAQAHVIVVSTSDSERDQEFVKELGADGYFRKPSEFDEFMKLGDLVKGVLSRDVN
jgi:chemotaxis family two-component system response regulator Rcp1